MWWAPSSFFHSCLSLAEYFSTYNDCLALRDFCTNVFRNDTLLYIVCSPFLFGLFPTASPPHQQRTNNPMSRSEHFLSYLIFLFQFSSWTSVSFVAISKFFSATFVQIKKCICPSCKHYLSKVKMDFDISFFFPHFQILFSFEDIC